MFPRKRFLVPGRVLAVVAALVVLGSAAAEEQSVHPGINDAYLKPHQDVAQWVERFENEGREVYDRRHEIVAALDLKPGMVVADVGAGTGLFTELFAKAVGPEGRVLAVDIVPDFLAHIQQRAASNGLQNVETVLCTERSVELPAASVDVVFVCNTYHHFEYPRSTLASIRRALRPGGSLVVVEFEREPGRSSDWMLKHVRAGKAVFSAEIAEAGFEPAGEVRGFLEQTYMIRFRKPSK